MDRDLIGAALERVVAVVREGERADPPIEAPAELRRYLRFHSLPGPALEAVQRVADADPQLRARAAEGAEGLDRASDLWLRRPEGWAQELTLLVERRAGAEELARANRRVQDLVRERDKAQEQLLELDRLARNNASDANDLRADLADERRRRRKATEDLDAAVSRLEQAEAAAAEHARRADEAQAALEVRVRELDAAHEQRRSLQEELARRPPAPEDAPAQVPAAGVRRRLARARRALEAVGDALGDVEALVAEDDAATLVGPDPLPPPAAEGVTERRHPSRLPGGLRDDSVEAAEHLLRLPRAVVAVDGYNVSMLGWGDEPLAEQRRRLEAGLERLAGATGVDPVVVYDGVQGGVAPSPSPRRAVRARFTDAGVEADDEVLALVEELPLDRPVVVVSNDRRVRDGAVARGANVVTSDVLLALLR